MGHVQVKQELAAACPRGGQQGSKGTEEGQNLLYNPQEGKREEGWDPVIGLEIVRKWGGAVLQG